MAAEPHRDPAAAPPRPQYAWTAGQRSSTPVFVSSAWKAARRAGSARTARGGMPERTQIGRAGGIGRVGSSGGCRAVICRRTTRGGRSRPIAMRGSRLVVPSPTDPCAARQDLAGFERFSVIAAGPRRRDGSRTTPAVPVPAARVAKSAAPPSMAAPPAAFLAFADNSRRASSTSSRASTTACSDTVYTSSSSGRSVALSARGVDTTETYP